MVAKRHLARFVSNDELALKTTNERTGYLNTLISAQAILLKHWQMVLIRRAERLGVW